MMPSLFFVLPASGSAWPSRRSNTRSIGRPRLVASAALALTAVVVMGANCDDRISPSTSCSDDIECGTNERCNESGECIASSAAEPEASPEGAEPAVSPSAEPGAEPSANPAVEPEGEPDSGPDTDAGVIAEPDDAVACQDLAEANAENWGVEHPFEDLDAFIDNNPNIGSTAIAVRTSFTQPARLVYPKRRDRSVDLSSYSSLVLSLRGVSSTEVFAPPVVILEDCDGNTKRFTSTRPLASGDPWTRYAVPLDASTNAWTVTGDFDETRMRGLFVEVNAQGGYDLSIDDVGFVPRAGEQCPTTCGDCGGRGTCDVQQGLPGCACECMDLAEGNETEWGPYASPDHATAVNTVITTDATHAAAGQSSIAAVTDASFDWAVYFPSNQSVIWDLSQTSAVSFWARGENDNVPDWQGAYPALVVIDDFGQELKLIPEQNLLNETWTHHLVPLAGGDGWTKTGDITLSTVRRIEFHADTWDNGFSFWVDGVSFRQTSGTCLETCLTPCAAGTCQDLRGMPTCY